LVAKILVAYGILPTLLTLTFSLVSICFRWVSYLTYPTCLDKRLCCCCCCIVFAIWCCGNCQQHSPNSYVFLNETCYISSEQVIGPFFASVVFIWLCCQFIYFTGSYNCVMIGTCSSTYFCKQIMAMPFCGFNHLMQQSDNLSLRKLLVNMYLS
jgi:hypothetical protein